jgi:hypothetical protein
MRPPGHAQRQQHQTGAGGISLRLQQLLICMLASQEPVARHACVGGVGRGALQEGSSTAGSLLQIL